MASHKDQRIKEMLGFGIKPESVANAIGCDPSYISQLMSIEAFAEEVAELRIKHQTAATERDLSYDALEDKLLSTMHDMVDHGRFQKPEQVLMALRVSNQMIRRGNSNAGQPKQLSVVVSLELPKVVRDRFIPGGPAGDKAIDITPSGEVVRVNGQTMVTMPSGQLVSQIRKDRKEGGQDEGNFAQLEGQIQRKQIA